MSKQLTPSSTKLAECLVPYGSIEYGSLMAKVGETAKLADARAEGRRAVRLITAKP